MAIDLTTAIFTHLPWPITVIVLALLFRKPLTALIERIESANSKYFKLTMATRTLLDKLGYAEGMADAPAMPAAAPPSRNPKGEHEINVKQLLNMASKQPPSAVYDAHQYLLRVLCDEVEHRTTKRPDAGDAIRGIVPYVSSGLTGLITSLIMIANENVSNSQASLSKGDAIRYVHLTSRTLISIKKAFMANAEVPISAQSESEGIV